MHPRWLGVSITLFALFSSLLGFRLYESLLAARLAASNPTIFSLRLLSPVSFGTSRAGVLTANPYTNQIFAAQEDVPALASIDAQTNVIAATIPLRGYHTGMTIDLLKNEIYVAQEFSQTVRVIDGTRLNLARELAVPGGSPIGELAFDSNTAFLYVIQNDIPSIAILNPFNGELVGTLPFNAHYGDLAINPQTQRLYVVSPLENKLTVVDTASNTRIATIPLGNDPTRVAVNPATNRIYVTVSADNVLAVIDGATNALAETIPVGDGPVDVAVNPLTNRIYVAHLESKDVLVIDGNDRRVLSRVTLETQPGWLALLPALNRVYASTDVGHGVFVLQDFPASAGDEISLESDANTRVMDLQNGAPPANWQQVNFDDALWSSAAPIECLAVPRQRLNTKALWIWAPGCSQYAQTVLLRKTFELPSRNFQGVLYPRADDTAQVHLNGELLGATQHWTTEYWYDLTPRLRAGKNVLAIQAWNGEGGYGGVLFRAALRAANVR